MKAVKGSTFVCSYLVGLSGFQQVYRKYANLFHVYICKLCNNVIKSPNLEGLRYDYYNFYYKIIINKVYYTICIYIRGYF